MSAPSPAAPSSAQPKPTEAAASANATQTFNVADIETRWLELGEPQRLAVISQLIASSHLDLAEKFLPRVRPTSAPGRKVALYLKAKLLKAQGRLPEAAQALDKLLAEDPNFSSARLDLAQTLFLQKQDDGARKQFEFLLASVSSADQRQGIQQYISAIDERRGWNLSVITGMSGTTNLSQRNDTILSGARGGVGGIAGVLGGWRAPINDSLDIMFAGSAIGTGYNDATFNDLTLTAEAGPRFSFTWGNIGLYATASQRWLGDDSSIFTYGTRLATFVKFGDSDRASLSAPCSLNRYEPTSDRNGWTCGVQASFDHLFSPQTFVRVLGGFERMRTEETELGYTSRNIGIGAGHDLTDKLSLYSQIVYARRGYDGVDPVAEEQRRDNRLDFSVQLSSREWEVYGLTPSLRYTYTLNRSNIEERSFDAHGVTFTLSKKF